MDSVALSNGLHGSVQMDSLALFSWIGWLRHRGILTFDKSENKFDILGLEECQDYSKHIFLYPKGVYLLI